LIGSSVTFGGVSATVVSYLGNAIVVTAPANLRGGVDVVVTTAGGSATSANGYSYLDPSSCNPNSDTYTVTGNPYRVLKFTNTGYCEWTAPSNVSQIRLLTVAGGGGGGGAFAGGGGGAFAGGGGAGGLIYDDSFPITPSSTYTVLVGAGGAGGIASLCRSLGCDDNSGGNGGDSGFGQITAGSFSAGSVVVTGGGGGGGYTGNGYPQLHTLDAATTSDYDGPLLSGESPFTGRAATWLSSSGIDSSAGKSGGSGGGSSENTLHRVP
jgi:hypothetical protein